MRLNGRIALVTGAGTGIGAAITERFVAEGAKVCITGRRKEKLEQEAAGFPEGSVVICVGDVSKYDDVKKMVATAAALGEGRIDILVNNAGTDIMGRITELDPDDWRYVLETNLTGPFMLMKETIPLKIKNGGGSIINVSSIGGIRCLPLAPAYGTSKAGLILLSKNAALEYGPFKIRCNALCPGMTRTELLDYGITGMAERLGTNVEGATERFASHLPLRRAAEPSEIASVCAFLASDDSSFMTGAVIAADGGSLIVDVSGASIS